MWEVQYGSPLGYGKNEDEEKEEGIIVAVISFFSRSIHKFRVGSLPYELRAFT